MPPDPVPPAPGNPPTPTPPLPSPAPPTPPPADELRMTQEQLNERLERAKRSAVKKFGVENEDELTARLKELDDLKKQEDERKKAQMTEIDRAKAEAAEHKAIADQARAAAATAAAELAIHRLASSNGVTQVDYLTFKLDSKERSLGEDARKTFDRAAYVKELLADPRERVALGLDAPGVPPPTPVPAGTVPAPAPGTPPPPGAGVPPAVKTAVDMNDEEWAARKSQLGIP